MAEMMQKTNWESEQIDQGKLSVQVTSSVGFLPVENATISITPAGQDQTPFEQVYTNNSGETEAVTLKAPPIEWSQRPSEQQPYANYTITVSAEGYQPVTIEGCEILSGETAILPVSMNPVEEENQSETNIEIGDHVLYGDYPAKLPEEEVKPLEESSEVVLSRVVIPEYVVVHDGAPSAKGKNYYIRYKDYIKNVVSSEIYATWPENAIYANIFCILSFTMNRVYTEWYRGKGYDFTITNNTAYDQKFIYGRNIYENISRIVDSVFANYLSRPGVKQPIFTSYCDGQKSECSGLRQWGSKYLAQEGYSPMEIIRYYYGADMYLNTAQGISGVPASWPGYSLSQGASGDKVRQMQMQLTRIARNFPAIPSLSADGIYGPKTREAVRVFQKIFNLPQTGVVDYATWYEISNIYVGVTRVAEPS